MLNETDLQTFNYAVTLAKSGRKTMANEIIAELLTTNLTDVNLYLWYAYTTEDFTKAYNAVALAHRYEPTNPSVLQAQNWLNNQFPQNRSTTTTATVTNPTATASRVKLNKLSRKMQTKLNAVLKPDEEVKWRGRPAFLLSLLNIFDITFALIGFGTLFGGIFLFLSGISRTPPYDGDSKKAFFSWGIEFMIGGAFLTICFLVTVVARLSTIYILTDRRAIIAKDILGLVCLLDTYTRANVKTYNTILRPKWGSVGDLIFASKATKYSNRDPSRAYEYRRRSLFSRSWGFGGDDLNRMIGSDGDIGIAEIGFTSVPNLEQVHKLFMETFDTTVVAET